MSYQYMQNPYYCNYNYNPYNYYPGSYNYNPNDPFANFQQYLTTDTLNLNNGVNTNNNTETEVSLTSHCKSQLEYMGGIAAIPHIRHPFNSSKALKTTWDLFKQNPELYSLNPTKQAEAFHNLFTAARLEPRVLKQGKRTVEEAANFTNAIKEARSGYIDALKAKDTIGAARESARLTTLTKEGTKGLFKGKAFSEVSQSAAEAGASAVKIAQEAQNVNKAIQSAKGFGKYCAIGKKWFKEGGGWLAVIFETLGQLPELIAAYSQGKRGDGIKQTAKSAVTVATNVTGWIAGTKIGTIAGTKIGAIIGSFFGPGPGTALGAAIGGFIGGLIGMAVGSWGAGKVSKAVVGKSFTEKQAEQLAQQQQSQQQQQQLTMQPQEQPQDNQEEQYIPYSPSNPFYINQSQTESNSKNLYLPYYSPCNPFYMQQA